MNFSITISIKHHIQDLVSFIIGIYCILYIKVTVYKEHSCMGKLTKWYFMAIYGK